MLAKLASNMMQAMYFLIAYFHHLGREKKVVQMALRKSAIGFGKFSIIWWQRGVRLPSSWWIIWIRCCPNIPNTFVGCQITTPCKVSIPIPLFSNFLRLLVTMKTSHHITIYWDIFFKTSLYIDGLKYSN